MYLCTRITFTNESLERYARMDMPMSLWLHMQHEVRQDEEAKRKVSEMISQIRDVAERKHLLELHEYFEANYVDWR